MSKMPRGLALSLLAALLFIAAHAPAQPAQSAQQVSVTKASPPPAPTKPSPDVVVFTNGDQLSGTLVRGVGNTIIFKSDMAGEISVSLDKVRELRSTGSFALLRKDVPPSRTSTLPGTVIFADGNVTVANPEGAPQVVPVKQMGYLIDQTTYDRELERRAGMWAGWNGTITGGATLVRSTTNANTFTAGVSLYRAVPTVPFLPARNRTTLNLQETYGKQTTPVIPQIDPANPEDVVVKTSIFHADAERDQYFSAKFFALVQTTFDHNFAQGLDLQQIYGGGIGLTPIKTAHQQLDVKADVHYEKQEFEVPSSNQDLIGSTFSEAYRRTLPRKLLFTESANVLPAWNNMSAYSANASAALAMPLFKRLGMQFSTTDNFLNDPAPGFRKNSYQFVTGVTYTLR